MKIIVAPDSYKECLPSRDVSKTLGDALRSALPGSDIVELPLADGGEGTVDVLTSAMGGHIASACVSDPLGRPVQAQYGVAGDTAVIEVAQACGLALLSPEERNPLQTSTFGVGELLLAAWNNGCRRFIVGLGGSSTCDGGAGMMAIPGLRDILSGATFEILCDVDAPFVGPLGAARVFGPQKGASAAEVEVLEQRMKEKADAMLEETGIDISSIPGAGAAGGLGGAFMAYFGAVLQPGIDRILDLLHFDSAVKGADLIVTGEGRSDRQTVSGKAPFGVLRRSAGVPVALLSGRIEDRDALLRSGFRWVLEVSPKDIPLNMALQPGPARQNLQFAVSRLLAYAGPGAEGIS